MTSFSKQYVTLGALVFVACKPAAPPHDDSTGFAGPDEPPALFIAPFAMETELQGAVTSIVPETNHYAKVTIDGPRPGQVEVSPVPFKQGDRVHVEVVCGGPPPYSCGGTVTSEGGALLLYAPPFSTVDGKGELPAGWTCTQGPRVGKSSSGEVTYYAIVEHGGRRAVIPPGSVRELDTADGRWLVRGAFVELASGQTPVADWRGAHVCSIVRL